MNIEPTQVMNQYMNEVFEIVVELYKSATPELLAEAFDMPIKDIKNMNSESFKRALNNLIIDYKIVDNKENSRISYAPASKENMILQATERNIENKTDILRMHLPDIELLNAQSVGAIKSIQTKAGYFKILEDIDYIAHEIGHALDTKIIQKNPSLLDGFCYGIQADDSRPNLDTGEAFAISMERILLDELRKPEQLQRFGLSNLSISTR